MVSAAVSYVLLLCVCLVVSAQTFLEVIGNETDLSNVAALLNANSDLVTTLDNSQNFTFLAPIDSAFPTVTTSTDSNSTRALLSYHCLNGTITNDGTLQIIHTLLDDSEFTKVTGGQVVGAVTYMNQAYFFSGLSQNSTAIGSPLNFSGGRIYKIDTVLTIPLNVTATLEATSLNMAGNFFNASGLTEFMDTNADTMVFVPSESAFQDVSSVFHGGPPGIDITRLAQYHMSDPALIYQTQLSQFEIGTIADVNVTIRQVSSTTFVNNAKVIVADILTSNGVIQVIDQVISPENTTLISRSASDTGLIAFAGGYNDGQPAFTSGNASINTFITHSTDSSPSTGAIAGGVVGGVAGLALMVLAIWYLVRRTARRLQTANAANLARKERHEMPASQDSASAELRADSRHPVELLQNERAELASEKSLYELPGSSPVPAELDSSMGPSRERTAQTTE